jgi:hypothetical protein
METPALSDSYYWVRDVYAPEQYIFEMANSMLIDGLPPE